MRNLGKQFENDFKASVPKNTYIYRFRDSTSAFAGGNTTYSVPNIADFMLFKEGKLFLLELKHSNSVSIPLNNIIGCKTKEKQIKELKEAKDKGIYAKIIIFFSSKLLCYSLDIDDFIKFVETTDRKSIPKDYLEEHATKIDVTLKRIHYEFDIEKYLKEVE